MRPMQAFAKLFSTLLMQCYFSEQIVFTHKQTQRETETRTWCARTPEYFVLFRFVRRVRIFILNALVTTPMRDIRVAHARRRES